MAVRAWAYIVLPLLAGGCANPESTERHSDLLPPNGITDVGPLAETPIVPWRVNPDPHLRIGGSAPGTEHQFIDISAVLVLPDNSVLVADGGSGLVRRYTRDGDFVEQLGAVGEGPGEFRSPTSLAWLPGDSVVVWDEALWRESVFDVDGRFARTVRYDPTATGIYPLDGMWPMEVRVARGGMRLVHLATKGGGKGTPSGAAGSLPDAALAIHPSETPLPRLMARLPGTEEVEAEAPWGPVQLSAPVAAGPRIAFHAAEGRSCLGHQRWPEILCVADDGTRLGVRWPDVPRLVQPTDGTIARWRAETVRSFGDKVGEGVAETIVQQVPIPRHHPAFGNLTFDLLGHLWIELGPVEGAEADREYLILDGEHAVVGRIRLPGMELVEIGADYLMGIRRDDFDVQEVVRMELTR